MTKMTTIKKLLTVLLTFIMAICLMPVVGVKADGDVASVYSPYTQLTTNYTTLQDAFTKVPEEGKITLLSDVTIAESETVTLRDNVGYFELDLNGHSFTINGTLSSVDQVNSEGYPGLSISSKTPGILNTKGIINLSIQPWTGDTINITGGTINKYLGVDGGTINISGGELKGGLFINNGGDADINVTISKNAKISNLSYAVYMDDEGNLAEGKHNIMLNLQGGYYDVNPTSYKTDTSGCNQIWTDQSKFVTLDESAIEEYNGQTDWDADHNIYKFRIKDTSCTHANTEVKNKADATCTVKGYTGDTVCKDCGVVIKEGSAIDPLGHEYGTPIYTWSDDGKTCTATVACTRKDCTEKITEQGTVTSAVTTQPTSDKKGITTYTATFKDNHFTTQTKTIEDIAVADSPAPTSTPVKDSVKKSKNTMSVKVTGKTYTAKALKNKKKTTKLITVKKAKGKVTYTLKSVTKSKFKKYFSIDSSTGKLTIKKGLIKGSYTIKVAVSAAGNSKFNALTVNKAIKITVK